MIKSNKLLDSPKEGILPTWKEIIMIPFLFMLALSIGQLATSGIVDFFIVDMPIHIGSAYEMYVELLGGFGLASLVLFLFVKNTSKRSMRTLGFYKNKAMRRYLKGVLIAFSGMGSIVIILSLMGQVTITVNEQGIQSQSILLGVIIVAAWIVQGAAEEMLLRGYMLPALVTGLDFTKGITVSAMVFALLHMGNTGITVMSFLNILFCGVALALLAIKEESIWAVCGFHTTWNLMQGNIFGIAVSGNSNTVSLLTTTYTEHTILNGGIFGIEGSLLTTLFMIGMIMVLVRQIGKKVQHEN